MPAYLASTKTLPITSLYPAAQVRVWDGEIVAAGNPKSQALALVNWPAGNNAPLHVQLFFDAAPGNFTFNVEFAADDTDASYALPLSTETPLTTWQITQAMLDPVNQAVSVDLPYVNARFVRLRAAVVPANAVRVTATIKR